MTIPAVLAIPTKSVPAVTCILLFSFAFLVGVAGTTVARTCDAEVRTTGNGLQFRCPKGDCAQCGVIGSCDDHAPLPNDRPVFSLTCRCEGAAGNAEDSCYAEILIIGGVVQFECVNNVACRCEPMFRMDPTDPICKQIGPHRFWAPPCWCVGGKEDVAN